MTNLQVVKELDKQIELSFKRSASKPEEKQLRDDIRKTQSVFREAHRMSVVNKQVAQATSRLLKVVTPEMASELRAILNNY